MKIMELTCLFWFVYIANVNGQRMEKAPMEIAGPKKWSAIGNDAKISDDGRYMMYTVQSEPFSSGLFYKKNKFILKSIDKCWEKSYDGVRNSEFSSDGKYAVLQEPDGKKIAIELKTGREVDFSISIVKSSSNNTGPGVDGRIDISFDNKTVGVYRSISDNANIIVEVGGVESDSLNNVIAYKVMPEYETLIAIIQPFPSQGILLWYDLKTGRRQKLWESKSVQKIEFSYNVNKSYLFFNLTGDLTPVNREMLDVDVWAYKDKKAPKPWQQKNQPTTSTFSLNLKNRSFFQLTKPGEIVSGTGGSNALVTFCEGEMSERKWNIYGNTLFYVVSLTDGSRRLINKEVGEAIGAKISANGKYIVFSNEGSLQFSVYNTQINTLYDISKGKLIFKVGAGYTDKRYIGLTWSFLSDSVVVCSDMYDLWKIDLTGINVPVCLTNEYGKKNKISFSAANIQMNRKNIQFSKELNGYLLNALDNKTKAWGFYKLSHLNGQSPERLIMSCHYYGGDAAIIQRAKSAAVYLVKREAVNEAPNFFVTKDFKLFTRMSDVQPEKDYNWMNVDLVRWKSFKGKTCEGLLYKPENFESKQKYPVVTLIYEGFSTGLNSYPSFDKRGYGIFNTLPVTWLVSNGYLVFIPDIEDRQVGNPLQDTYDILISGVEHISSFPFVNPQKIGLQGASWGGMQTNYIVSHSSHFAAVFSAAGYSEYVSCTGFLDEIQENCKMYMVEGMYGGLLTQVPERYIEESPLFSAHKVTTPLLLRHNKDDAAVPFYQDLQYFMLLRRLGKKVWMLQYDKGGHGVGPGKNLDDMNLRIAQFFDHYLKDKPAPKWMTEGIEPNLRQMENRRINSPGHQS